MKLALKQQPRPWSTTRLCWRQPEMFLINTPLDDFIAQTTKLASPISPWCSPLIRRWWLRCIENPCPLCPARIGAECAFKPRPQPPFFWSNGRWGAPSGVWRSRLGGRTSGISCAAWCVLGFFPRGTRKTGVAVICWTGAVAGDPGGTTALLGAEGFA